ncbi:hypothetical protein CSC94_17910 [Zhengella mangrovi]|uniref:Uncharacterized protein n=2 Tax=Zhengella mangrovi TaxID=1982044 RepID=A0A2G1QJT8_9HYPH|nr:hypothetical protein CSC94_17910 [Zhengella mangrovi]
MNHPAATPGQEAFEAFGEDQAAPEPFVAFATDEVAEWEPLVLSEEPETAAAPLPATADFEFPAAEPELPSGGLEPLEDTQAWEKALSEPSDFALPPLDAEAANGAFEPFPDLATEEADDGMDPEEAAPEGDETAGEQPAGTGDPLALSGELDESGDSDDYGFMGAVGGIADADARIKAQSADLAGQLATGLDRLAVELSETLSATIGRILEPIVATAVRDRTVSMFMAAVREAVAARPGGPFRLEVPRDLLSSLRGELEKQACAVDLREGPPGGLTLHLDREVLATRFEALSAAAGDADDA